MYGASPFRFGFLPKKENSNPTKEKGKGGHPRNNNKKINCKEENCKYLSLIDLDCILAPRCVGQVLDSSLHFHFHFCFLL
jgi:hypothetical protein